jgi:hypothetical protein
MKKTRRKSREGRFSDATVATYYGDSCFSFTLPLTNGLWFGLWCDVTDGHSPAEDSGISGEQNRRRWTLSVTQVSMCWGDRCLSVGPRSVVVQQTTINDDVCYGLLLFSPSLCQYFWGTASQRRKLRAWLLQSWVTLRVDVREDSVESTEDETASWSWRN